MLAFAMDEVQASARARSEPVPLLHPWEGSGAAGAIAFHATKQWPWRPVVRPVALARSLKREFAGTRRWVVERTIAWLHQYRRLRVRYERRADIHEALLRIACTLICFKLLEPS